MSFWRAKHDEFEEYVFGRDIEIARHLIALFSGPTVQLSPNARAVKRATELRIAAEAVHDAHGAMLAAGAGFMRTHIRKADQLEKSYPGIS